MSKYRIMAPDFTSVITLAIALVLHLATIIQETTGSSGGIGAKCETYHDCQQEKLLECTGAPRYTCDCALKSVYSAIQQKCVAHVGERCILPNMDHRMAGPLPGIGCVDNAKCVHKSGSGLPFNHGICECMHGFYRTEESYCFKHPDPSSSSSSSSNNKHPSLSNVLNSIPSSSDSKPSGHGHHHYSNSNNDMNLPPPYHGSLTRSSAARATLSCQCTIIASLVVFVSALVIS